jgi:hypothetical protein
MINCSGGLPAAGRKDGDTMLSTTLNKYLRKFLLVAVVGLALTALTGCYLGGGPFRHAFIGGGHHRGGTAYRSTPDGPQDFYSETGGYGPAAGRGYRQRGYCGW